MNIVVAALYHFSHLDNYQDLRKPLQSFCSEQKIKGTLLLAEEGINGTIAGSREGIDAVLEYLRQDTRLSQLSYKESYTEGYPFYRMKVKLKKEIVPLGVEGVSPTKKVGTYVKPKEWNQLLLDPEVVVIDTRNDYEVRVGTFKNAQNPETERFRDFPGYIKGNLDQKEHKKVAMFCTGGIRCEKASSFMLEEGFEEVYHLQGGILKYLEEVPEEESLWEGECFVFDQRVTVLHGLKEGEHVLCFGCRSPLSNEDIHSPHYKEGISCPYCYNQVSEDKKKRLAERQKQIELAKSRGEEHIGQRPR